MHADGCRLGRRSENLLRTVAPCGAVDERLRSSETPNITRPTDQNSLARSLVPQRCRETSESTCPRANLLRPTIVETGRRTDVPEIVRSHFKEGVPVERLMRSETSVLRAEILANREKREAALRSREASGAVPDDLLQVLRGFQESRALLSAIELDLFSSVGSGASARSVAAGIRADARATEMLLNALAAMGFLTKKNETFFNTKASARFLATPSPDNARAAIMHMVHLWPRWSTLTDCVRSGTSVLARAAKLIFPRCVSGSSPRTPPPAGPRSFPGRGCGR